MSDTQLQRPKTVPAPWLLPLTLLCMGVAMFGVDILRGAFVVIGDEGMLSNRTIAGLIVGIALIVTGLVAQVALASKSSLLDHIGRLENRIWRLETDAVAGQTIEAYAGTRPARDGESEG